MRRNISIFIILLSIVLSGCSTSSTDKVLKSQPLKQESKKESVQAGLLKEAIEVKGNKAVVNEIPIVASKEDKPLKEVNGFVQVKDLDKSIVIDLKYATSDNFTGKKIYPVSVCLIRKETGYKLVKVNEELKKQGYRLKVWDAYRPPYVQKILWNTVSDKRFVANPYKGGSKHNKGCAVDVTLVDSKGNEVKMPTKFDDFSPKAFRSNKNISKEVKNNLELLTETMKKNGFTTINSEWWHYDDIESKNYSIIDINLEEFLK